MQLLSGGGREQPWHERRASAKHHQWFRDLVELHELTASWVKAARLEPAPPPVLPAEARLEELLDDTYPDDVLGRLDRAIWAAQARTLAEILGRAPQGTPEGGVLVSLLEQACFNQGRRSAERRWPALQAEVRDDLRGLRLALVDSPFNGNPGREAFLVKRATASDVQLELRACPHQSGVPEAAAVADALCGLHLHWMRGFIYGLSTRATLERVGASRGGRCVVRWYFVA
jgi:hypothetical protein